MYKIYYTINDEEFSIEGRDIKRLFWAYAELQADKITLITRDGVEIWKA